MIKWIIFSKNRPAQLWLLLESMRKHHPTCHPLVIYKATDDQYARGYRVVRDEFLKPYWLPETNFRADLMNSLSSEATGFLVDDDIFVDYFWPGSDEYHELIRNDKVACLSLRLHPGVTYSYTKDIALDPPEFTRHELNMWQWRGRKSYWGYPMSLDGHIFRTEDLRVLLSTIDFNNPNELEGMMAAEPINKPYMICYDKPRVVNIPMNLVNTTVNNRNMQMDAVTMNEMFLRGYRLKVKVPEILNACHVELKPKMI
jgi:hypothetical protein